MSQGINQEMTAVKSKRVIRNLRWWVLVLFLMGVTVNYITRNSLGILAPELKTSLGITTEQYSWIVGAFQLAYTLFQPLCGWLIDVIGLKLGFLICASLWALMCILHAGAGSWLHLAILRFLMGGAEAAATPANAKTLGEWFPKKERPVAAGWAGVGFSIGAMLAPPIIYFAHATFGWQGAFLFTGILALGWVILWWLFYYNPEQHPRLGKEHGMDLKQIAMFAWLPFLAADLGSVASGYLTKLYVRWFGCTRVNSVVASSVTGAFLMVSLAIVTLTRDPYITIVLISIGGFGHQIISCMLSALVVESFDKGQMATVNGMRGSCAWIASFIFSLIIGVTADKIGFNPLFIAMGFFDLIGAFFLIAFIAERRVKRA